MPHNLPAATAEAWHLDRKVPLTIVVTVLSAIATGLWFAAIASHRLDTLERSDALNTVRMDAASSSQILVRERLSRIEQLEADNQDMLKRVLERITR